MPSIRLKNGELRTWEYALIMGVINCNPDSYYLSSTDTKDTLLLAEQMITEGADIIDLGAMSSKPGSEIISPQEEWERIEAHLHLLREKFPNIIISIDTVHSSTAHQAIEKGADMINDISFGQIDSHIWQIAKKAKVPYIGMHMQGIPSSMQENPQYDDVVREVYAYLSERVSLCEIDEDKIILDIGIGFGKTIDQNFELLAGLDYFTTLNKPLLVGISRKSLLYKLLDSSPHEMLAATSALHMYVLQQGANLLRVHDVKEAQQVKKIYTQILKSKKL